MRIRIVDTVGLAYDGTTVENQGLGGSESAVIYMAESLSLLGHDVRVGCTNPNRYTEHKGVIYEDHSIQNFRSAIEECDIFISVRSVEPFYARNMYARDAASSKYKVLWMHDTFCEGDASIEDMLNRGYIDTVFTLSDFHTNYFLNSNHGNPRNFEVLKDRVFQTRNGIKKHIQEPELVEKRNNSFVYNASATKGLVPLIEDIWPRVIAIVPDATLDIIGGFYRLSEEKETDEKEKKGRQLNKKSTKRSEISRCDNTE